MSINRFFKLLFCFVFLIEQLNVIIGFYLYSWQPFTFNFACETPEKKKKKKLQQGTREWQILFF